MDIRQTVKKPQLIQLAVDSEDIVAQYGEPVVFHMVDYLDLGTYFEFYKLQQAENANKLIDILRRIVLDSQGQPVIAEDEILPIDLSLAILYKINDHLGKLNAKVSTDNVGTQQN